ncbi:hypothetical protein FHS68_000071 [Dyadobacter arcticus]|uniref:Uncharacterized protein n=1 Tax=Dyadobacter arcticus TaxID=1078754 RepID=A0ABX0UHR0_9BACT|nr:hypothetical protein [Dyadobacter arcticus]
MSEKERQVLEEKLKNLKNILDFYVKYRNEVGSMNRSQMESHIDDILDMINDIKKQLGQ